MNDALAQPMTDPAAADPTPAASRGTRIFTDQLFRVRDGRGWTFSTEPPAQPREPVRRPARVARMLALAHRLEAAIDRGDHRDRAELARQLGFTWARVTQLLDILLLAPDVAGRVLFLEAVDGVEPPPSGRCAPSSGAIPGPSSGGRGPACSTARLLRPRSSPPNKIRWSRTRSDTVGLLPGAGP